MRSIILFVFTLLSINVPVLASSRLWQPPVTDEPGLDRRYLTIPVLRTLLGGGPLGFLGDQIGWPNRRITYCFDSDEAKRKLNKHIQQAHKLWKSAGLNDDFKVVEGTKEMCTNDEYRGDVLMISYGRMLRTYVGFPKPTSTLVQTLGRGAFSTLTDRTDVGMLDVVPNIAHELGHAWGLYHEHQNSYFWNKVTDGPIPIEHAGAGQVFGPSRNGNWQCKNLLDYDSFKDGKEISPPNQMPRHYSRDELCNSHTLAQAAGFSAADYLPMRASLSNSPILTPGDARSVDWDSIMIYPSGAGAIEGTEVQENDGDKRLSILERPPDPFDESETTGPRSRILKNKMPSVGDIEGMKQIYGDFKVAKGRLLQRTAQKLFAKGFTSSRGESSGCL